MKYDSPHRDGSIPGQVKLPVSDGLIFVNGHQQLLKPAIEAIILTRGRCWVGHHLAAG
jgi:hypothetical protein